MTRVDKLVWLMAILLTLSMAFYIACGSSSDDTGSTRSPVTGGDDDTPSPGAGGGGDDDDDTAADDDTSADDDTGGDDDTGTDDDTGGDDDTGADDDTAVDDDDDDDTPDYTCSQVADGSINTCSRDLNGVSGTPVGQTGMQAWCEATENLFGGKALSSVFWNCWGDCVFEQSCGEPCFSACENPPVPGSGCGATAGGLYACGVHIQIDTSDYFIQLLDLLEFCEYMTEWPWECYQTCVDTVSCSTPPTPSQTNNMFTCMEGCWSKK
ncbi:MAG: hypothetical protein P9L99_15620 [Candidatus Lernaella stagnicola]|nr:hypothetical protein [Candidatus Lernaella stagnicola]